VAVFSVIDFKSGLDVRKTQLTAPGGSLRILDNADERTVAAVLMELPVPVSATLVKSMYSRRRAAQVLTHVRPSTAAAVVSPT
jgi:hypothetical protein